MKLDTKMRTDHNGIAALVTTNSVAEVATCSNSGANCNTVAHGIFAPGVQNIIRMALSIGQPKKRRLDSQSKQLGQNLLGPLIAVALFKISQNLFDK